MDFFLKKGYKLTIYTDGFLMHGLHRIDNNSESINGKEVKTNFKSKKSMKYNIQQK